MSRINATDFLNEDDYNEARYEEEMGYQGDARRCHRHPNVVTSSADGMHDGICGECEAECDDAHQTALAQLPEDLRKDWL